ncbi:MAG: hypothetical protein ACTSX9_04185 [Candidatus Njordarchaeales archaeon]
MEDATKELGIPELYGAVKERMEMLNMYIQTAYQKASNVLFLILNTLVVASAIAGLIAFFQGIVTYRTALLLLLAVEGLWITLAYKYFSRYIS